MDHPKNLSDDGLIAAIKFQAEMWFNNQNLLLLNELIRRYENAKRQAAEVHSTIRQVPDREN